MKLNRRGLFGTITVHGLVLLLLILGGLTFPDPPPEEEGVLVNFGTEDTGYGLIEPEGDEANMGTPEPEEYIPVTTPPPKEEETTQADNTQDIEEVKVVEEAQPDAEELQKQREEQERIANEQEEERIRIEEEQRIEQEKEEERKRLEEQANRINNLGRNTFGNQDVGEQDGSQGITGGTEGNQGVEIGSPGAPNYGDGSGLGNGPTYGLGSRKAIGDLPLPDVENCNVTSRIIVTVEIKVDREGNVLSANVSSATFSDNCIWNVVIEAAKKTKFTRDENAAFSQTGWIKYTIEP
ncbi:hypothetical protein ACFLT1_08045 [Bacteroidota bacterium]